MGECVSVIQTFQALAGLLWIIPLLLFAPSVIRIWRNRADALDVVLSPVAFLALNQIGFTVRWLLFPRAVSVMRSDEIMVWAGLYTMSALCVVGLVGAYSAARRVR